MKVAAIITAQEEAVGAAYFCHRPLVSWSIVQAQRATTIQRVFVQTDSQRIGEIARSHGVSVISGEPIHRQTAWSTISDDLREATGTNELEILVVLPVGAPLRQLGDIDRAVRIATDEETEVLVAGTVWKESEVWHLDVHGDLHALQDVSTGKPANGEGSLFVENCAISVVKLARPPQVDAPPRIRPFPLSSWQTLTISEPSDIEACEAVFRRALLPALEQDAPVAPDTLTGEVDLVVYDFDGVMTDNRVLVTQDGTEAVWVNRADGLGVERFRKLGIPQLVLSTEVNPVVSARAAKLRLPVIQGSSDKKAALLGHCQDHSIDPRRVVFVGNDVNDAAVMQTVGWPIAPSDAHDSVKRIARIITRARGGEGVIKELAERFFGDGEA